MDTDDASQELNHIMALVQEQMRDLGEIEQKRGLIKGTGSAADGAVVVIVDAQHVVTKVDIDETFLDEHELTDLGDFVTTAAQRAVQEVDRQTQALLVPMSERREELAAMSSPGTDMPDIQALLSSLHGTSTSLSEDTGVWDQAAAPRTVRS